MLTCKHRLCANAAPTQIAFEWALRYVYVIEGADARGLIGRCPAERPASSPGR